MEKEFYYCYSPNLYKFIKNKGFNYICKGRSTSTGRKFWMYKITDEFSQALKEYSAESYKYRVGLNDMDNKY